MGSQNTEFHRSAFLIDARGPLTAMDDLTGGRLTVYRFSEPWNWREKNARAGAFRGDEVNVVWPNHDDHGGAILALDRVGKLSQFGVDHALGDGSRNEVRLTDKVGHEGVAGMWYIISGVSNCSKRPWLRTAIRSAMAKASS